MAFDPIKIQTCLAPRNDSQHLSFVKDIYVAGKKLPKMVVNWPKIKVVSFSSPHSLVYVLNEVRTTYNRDLNLSK